MLLSTEQTRKAPRFRASMPSIAMLAEEHGDA